MKQPPVVVHIKTRQYKYWDRAEHDNQLFHLHAAKLVDSKIAEIMGFSEFAIRTHRIRLGLQPHNVRHTSAAPEYNRLLDEKIDPLEEAALYVEGFNRAEMTVNGRTIHLNDLMQRTNAARVANGLPQIGYSSNWLVCQPK